MKFALSNSLLNEDLSTGSPLIGRFLGPRKTGLIEICPIRGVFMV